MTEGCSHEVRAWVSVEQVDRAARACMRRKASRRDALAFRLRYGEEVLSLTRRLAHETYRPEPGIVFVTDRPKLREVHAAAFRDRVVHHLLHELLAPRFESGWSSRTFACRKGLGTHAAVRCLERLVHDASRRGGRRAWGLQLDIASFFPSVHKPTLVRLLGSRFSRAERGEPLFGLIRTIVEHDSTRGARRCGRLDWFDRVPLHKRLGSQGPDRGLPIGNLTSQFFAGIYLASLDHFVQRTIGIGSYVRYMDDLVLVDTDPARLGEAHARIEDFLSTRLLLSLRATSRLEPVSEGIDFLGYVVRPTYSLVRNRVFANLRRRSSEIETSLAPTQLGARQTLEIPGVGQLSGPCVVQTVDPRAIERARSVWASFAGHLAHGRGRRLLLRCWAAVPATRRLLTMDERGCRVNRRFALPALDPSFPSQLARLRHGLRGSLLLVRVGRRWEWHGAGARLLGPGAWIRRGARRVRFCHRHELAGALRGALDRGISVAIATERPTESIGPRGRSLVAEVSCCPATDAS